MINGKPVMDWRRKREGCRFNNGDGSESKAHIRCEGRKKSQRLLKNIPSKSEGVKRRLKGWKVRKNWHKIPCEFF